MLHQDLKTHLETAFPIKIESVSPLSGGDINDVYKLKCANRDYVAKLNKLHKFPGMFQKEANGLKALRDTGAIDGPEVLGFGDFQDQTYLLLEYKETGEANAAFWETFGAQMAALHKNSRENFGFQEDNFFGSLPQYNNAESTAASFFINQRLKPQFKMAVENGFEFNNLDSFYQKAAEIIPNEKPALIHGDLWSGNYVINSRNKPCLIDPAVAYAPREMDLAMMQLFGGFNPRLFETYHEIFPLENEWKDRVKLWQLYYIMGHVNLFGGHYYHSAKNIISSYC
ncbi:hypothetical protein SAMN05444483_107118 [Salegentibacter echinorum]|uniref:Protein kinase domain-containing protein n=1 Tax=Salegentibacter echinorum TaxID=1073325 RepID=A0A1M5IEI6_SALEC|nr:fructosamine kinase family protein [Salegentibacter echinorum]SHG26738.1 hypothetical protein SAMN05444483_107118 [Salegentibacter echinorum]